MDTEKVLCKLRKIYVTLLYDGPETVCLENPCHKKSECTQICGKQRTEHPSGEISLSDRIRPFIPE